jgi:hypothetical protein
MTLEPLEETQEQLTLFVADSPAKIYQWPESARGLLENGQDYGSSLRELLTNLSRDGLLLRTSPAYYPQIEGQTLPLSFDGWSNAGMAFAGGYLTLSISEFPSAAAVCSLSEVLETDAPQKYYLSAKACRGILRRAEKRGKMLPTHLEATLRTVATKAMEE